MLLPHVTFKNQFFRKLNLLLFVSPQTVQLSFETLWKPLFLRILNSLFKMEHPV